MGEIDFTEIQQVLDGILGSGLDFEELAVRGAGGERLFSWESLAGFLREIFFKELLQQRQLWAHILILAVAAAVLVHFADVFENRSVSQISFCMIYMLLFLLLLSSFRGSMEIAGQVMENMGDFMTALAPAYLLAMTLSAQSASAGVYYEFILLLISGVQLLVRTVILPAIEVYVLLTLVNGLSKEGKLGRLAELMEMLVSWGLKAALAAVMGFHMIQGLITPAADSLRASAVTRGMEMVPVLGDAGSSMTELVLGSAVMIKNGIGAAALAALIFLCLIPLTKLALIMAAYYLLSAVLQPVSEERITACLSGMGHAVKLLFQAVFTVLALFLLTIALSAASG